MLHKRLDEQWPRQIFEKLARRHVGPARRLEHRSVLLARCGQTEEPHERKRRPVSAFGLGLAFASQERKPAGYEIVVRRKDDLDVVARELDNRVDDRLRQDRVEIRLRLIPKKNR